MQARELSEPIATDLINSLTSHGLVDLAEAKLTLTHRYSEQSHSTDAAFAQLRARIAPELTQTTWLPTVSDSGVAVLSARQNFLIEISGRNRVATLLYSLLLASGATQTRFAPTISSARITDTDIAVAGITPQHIGTPLNKERESHRADFSLFPLDKKLSYLDEASSPDLIIHCGEIDPQRYAQWMMNGQKFLHIPSPIADTAQIGPLVDPGHTPCVRCAELTLQDQTGMVLTQSLTQSPRDDYPIIAAHYVAAVAAAMAIQWCDYTSLQTPHHISGRIIICDYQSLTTPIEVALTRHPLCGCSFH